MLELLALSSLKRVGQTIKENYKIQSHGLNYHTPKVHISKTVGSLEIKTASNIQELRKAFKLRHEVFYQEMQGHVDPDLDIDEFDMHCDHLIIVDHRTEQIVGTYRMNCSAFQNEKFYSATEFEISDLMTLLGVKLELGRACIQKEYRRGIVISLLWRGISEYMNAVNADYLFGCATIKTEDPYTAALLSTYFGTEDKVFTEKSVFPLTECYLPIFELWLNYFKENPLTEAQKEQAADLLPPLCRAYLKIGARVAGIPAWDKGFKCIDFLTILSREELNRSLWTRFKAS